MIWYLFLSKNVGHTFEAFVMLLRTRSLTDSIFFLFFILLYFSGNKGPLYSSHLLAKLNHNAKSGLIWSTTCTVKDPTKLNVKKWSWRDTLWNGHYWRGSDFLYYNIWKNKDRREINSTVLILYFIPVTRFARSIIPTTHNVLMLRALPTSYQKHKRKEK
jgi:hypothetical protein